MSRTARKKITSPPLFVRLGQGHAHAYYQETASIISYPLTDVAAPIPAGIVTKLMDGGIVLNHIIPGVRNGTSFLACIGTNTVSFVLFIISRAMGTRRERRGGKIFPYFSRI
jgi:hypothetical protein